MSRASSEVGTHAATANQVPLSPLSFLNRAADVFPQSVAMVGDDGSEFSYASSRERAVRLSNAVRATGAERVAVLAPNDVPMLEAHYGVPAAGAVLVALNVRSAPREYAYILRHSRCEVVIVDHTLVDRIGEIRDEVEGLELVVEITEAGLRVGDVSYEDWIQAQDGTGPLQLPHSETEPIAVNYTSGTTGEPKGAVYTHRGAYLNALGQALEFGLGQGSVYLWTLPMFHCNGWCFTWAVTAVGGTHVAMRHFDPDVALEAIATHEVTHFCGAPVVLNEMAHATSAAGRTFGQRVVAATGGAPPSPTVIGRMRQLGIEVVHLYGLTETYGPSVVCEPQPGWSDLPAEQRAELMSRQGVRTINVEGVRVVDGGLRDVPRDGETIGEIVIRSNTVMDAYLDAPASTREALRGGWFHTGDLAVVHADGYLEVRDRAKDIIISGGENVSSIEVENVIAAHPDVLEVAVVGRNHAKWGEVPVAFTTPREGHEVDPDDITEWVRERLAHYKAPAAVHIRTLPKTSTGKVRKTELREIAAAESRD